tara:strand:+ start:149902 stop:150096 length:195 start_codon:yes stop_codon:yes gene_type:complete
MQTELLNVHEVAKITNYKSRASIYNLMKSASFPVPVRVGARTVRWLRADVDAWLEGLKQKEETV